MSYLQHIKDCNNFKPEDYLPFMILDTLVGWAKKDFVDELKSFNSVFYIDSNYFTFVESLKTAEERTQAITPVVKQLYQEGVIKSWVGETYSITNKFGDLPFFEMERAAVAYFGVRSYGVHVNGLVEKEEGIYIWIARRTKLKPFWPGKLDQIVAGGQPAGISLMDNVIKESAEEANIPKSLASQAMNSDTLFNYDLWLPDHFIPENTDGEVDEFVLMSLEEMAYMTDTTQEFKNNCNLVNIDLLLRLGVISENHPDYDEINHLLYAPAKLK